MVYRTVNLGGGLEAIVCSRGRRKQLCSVAECYSNGTLLCDFPDAKRKSGTCDKPVCHRHATKIGPDVDYCPAHR